MKNVYYPLAGMNYVLDDLAQIIENKMKNKKRNSVMVICTSKLLSPYRNIN